MTKFLERREKSRKISKDIVVLYHSNCTDGFGGAWAAWKKFGDKAEYIGVIHQTPVPKGLKNKCIYSVDFTYPEPIVKKLILRPASFRLGFVLAVFPSEQARAKNFAIRGGRRFVEI